MSENKYTKYIKKEKERTIHDIKIFIHKYGIYRTYG